MNISQAYFARARRVSPGGVHSPVRAFGAVGGTPLFMKSASGAMITDVDGRDYIDFCMSFGPLIFGHRDQRSLEVASAALKQGWTLGTPEPYSLALAELITRRIPWVESLRLVNSGTEAVMSVLRLARAATGRPLILKFDGCYHGHADAMLISAGSGLAHGTRSDSAGISPAVAAETLIVNLDDAQSLDEVFTRYGSQIAAAIIEPLPANHGLLPQRNAFLGALADRCRTHGSLLIFDEVITGFRLAFGGYAEICGIHPDLVTYGKVIGGGFPMAAYGGQRNLMEQIAPSGAVYQAGTLSANPLAVRTGLSVLKRLEDGAVYRQLESLGRSLSEKLSSVPGLRVQQIGSLFWIAPDWSGSWPARCKQSIPPGTALAYPQLFHHLRRQGIFLPPSPFETGFLSTAHNESHIDQFVTAVAEQYAGEHQKFKSAAAI